ncbi:hypothetical protein CspHIS471_0703110 [Cutaneotrichosporon sp. HIS471]|nr:hypothetical protein CspHIS471_0703110 [Cutaneotrichosporon sp. HIS471]
MDRRTSVTEGSLSNINWASVAPPLMPPSAKTTDNPLRRLSLAKSELPPPPAPTPEPIQDRQRRESLAALYPPTPSGVIALARDAASNHSTTVIVIAVGIYALLGHINGGVYEMTTSGLQNQLAEQVAALRAELAALKAAKE